MGRRLWWQVGSLESKTADLAGVTNTADIHLWDTKLPANLNDSDLSPQMNELPSEHAGATEMAFSLVRYYVGEFQRTSPSLNGSWELLVRAEVSVEEKKKIIMELETMLQEKVLQHLDRGIPLHLVTIGAARGFVDRLRLLYLHPRLYPDRRPSMSQSDKDKLFDLCLSIVQRDNWGHTLQSVQEYLWHIDSQFQSDAFIYLLHELRYQCMGKQADVAWPQILETFEHHPEILHGTNNPLWVAIGNLTLKSWTARERALAPGHRQSPPEGIHPQTIMILRAQRIPLSKKIYTPAEEEIGHTPANTSATNRINHPGHQVLEDRDVFDSEDFVAPHFDVNDPIDVAPVDWTYWNNLIQESELPVGDS